MNINEWAVFLNRHHVYNALQFIRSTRDYFNFAVVCKDLIPSIIGQMDRDFTEWKDNLEFEPVEGNPKLRVCRMVTPPMYETCLGEISIPSSILLDMTTINFFQYCRNAFDSMAQLVNAACLASKALDIENVDFGRMLSTFLRSPFKDDFPEVTEWLKTVKESQEYKYIDSFCNRVKHTCTIKTKHSQPLIGKEFKTEIEPFFRHKQEEQLPSIDPINYVDDVYDFVTSYYEKLMPLIKANVLRELYVEYRNYEIEVYQQFFKGSAENSFSYAFIESDLEASALPDEIQILFTVERTDKEITTVDAMNCPFDTVFVKRPNADYEFICKYVSDTYLGKDTLLHYRKYQKKVVPKDTDSLFVEASTDPRQRGLFYHNNAYFQITSISDDEHFIGRIQLPF